jgi:NAD(P) transhydrogenase
MDYDLIVIGTGPAGEKAAAQAAYFGKRVLAIERASEPGGAGTHTGTVPSKTLREASMYLSGYRSRDMYGIAVELEKTATLPRLMSRKAAIESSESSRIRHNLDRHGVTCLHGIGGFLDTHTVLVANPDRAQRVTGEVILIATGSRPAHPAGIDFTDDRIHDSDEILDIEQIPTSLAIVGAGVIGCEYACMFAALGVKVTLVDARDSMLGFLDHEMVAQLTQSMRRMGVEVRLGLQWTSVRRSGGEVVTRFESGAEIASEHLLYTAGREGRTKDLNLRAVGIEADNRGYTRVTKPTCRASSPPATSSAFPRSRRPRWSRGGWRYAMRSVSHTSSRWRSSCPTASTRFPR